MIRWQLNVFGLFCLREVECCKLETVEHHRNSTHAMPNQSHLFLKILKDCGVPACLL